MTNRDLAMGSLEDAPVLGIISDCLFDYPDDKGLPGLWITAPVVNEDGAYLGRIAIDRYAEAPGTTVYDPERDALDPDGDIALDYGASYYREAMDCGHAEDHARRVDCFRAAELLYRHAAGRGSAIANLNLGYVYSYDRCEGRYWRGANDPLAEEPFPRKERAFACLSKAAEAGIAEAAYKLGDLYKHGTGCEPNANRTFECYRLAEELCEHEPPSVVGSIALRLASCLEEGFGCVHDFAKAKALYEQAASALEVAVDYGDTWYGPSLASARRGVKRCAQELY